MRANEINELLRTILLTGLSTRSIADVNVKMAYQPTQQGIDLSPTIYFTELGSRPYGALTREDKWNLTDLEEVHTEEQIYEITYQINALVIEDPTANPGLSASDLVKIAQRIINSDVGRQNFRTAGLSLLRPTEIRNPYFKDDRDQFEASPSFDFTLIQTEAEVTTSPVVETIVININRI